MNLVHGIHHKRTGLDYAIIMVQVAICAVVIGTVAFYFAEAWIAEDTARVEKLAQHIYDVALNRERATVEPSTTPAPPDPTDLAEPKVRYFQDASQPQRKGK
jgi:uncharacterized membrane protein